jgi:hypothetical protein
VEPATTGVLLRRKFNRPLALLDRNDPGQPLLGFAEVLGGKREVWEYAAFVTSLDRWTSKLGQYSRPSCAKSDHSRAAACLGLC